MDEFTTESTYPRSQRVLEPIIIYQKERARRIFRADTNDAKLLEGETVSGTIIHQKKNKDDVWENISDFTLTNLKSGEGVKLHFDSEQTKHLYDGLTQLYSLSKEGIHAGRNKWIEVSEDRSEYIKELLRKNHGEEVWEQLVAENPDLATRLSLSRIQAYRQSALDEFEENLKEKRDEDYWQDFFKKNTWVFGYGLKYVFLQLLKNQPSYGGIDFTGKGNRKGDFLCNSEANIRFTVLVEIKRPDTPLFKMESGKPKPYRNGVCQLSEEFVGAISQLQMNCRSWERNADNQENVERLSEERIYTVNPKGILIIGNTIQLSGNLNARNTFESFRSHISGIDIITYDELFERAKFIVANTGEGKEAQSSSQSAEELPF